MENAASRHPSVAEAVVIGVAHSKWQERPILLVRLRAHATAQREEILEVSDKVARWWLPDDVIFVEELPRG
ncbi:hypothetical protein BZM27_55340, partial [Paraburkholderia steynii]